jgi:multicomponent Na+:H+ antiporter subunit G
MSDVIGGVLILVGAIFGAISGIGQLRFDDLFTRMHVATKPATLGLLLVAVGAMFRLSSTGAITLLALSIVLQFLTAPVSAHLVARSAHRRGDWAHRDAIVDHLGDVDEL